MRKPAIGITIGRSGATEDYGIRGDYIDVLQEMGVGVVLLPASCPLPEDFRDVTTGLDGIVLSGGPDPDPVLFGEEPWHRNRIADPARDSYEIGLTQAALQAGIPVLGICRGIQVINIAAGGDIYHDLPAQVEPVLEHVQDAPSWYPTHSVEIHEGTYLRKAFAKPVVRVNSNHHQAVRRVGPGFVEAARSSDGVVEAIEAHGGTFAIGVQWHPEKMRAHDPEACAVYSLLVDAARERMANS
jgi:putative glutamine amidotransferase